MKMAAAEALWDTESPASMSLFTIGDMKERKDVFAIRVPDVLSILACNNTSCAVQGINDLQAEYEAEVRPWRLRAVRGADLLELPRDGGRRYADAAAGAVRALPRAP